MRIGIIADIHGNLFALDKVLEALHQEPLDQIICLGDVAALGPQPIEVLARLRELGCPVVMGNTDNWHLAPPGADRGESLSPPMDLLADWCRERLNQDDLAYIATFQPTVEVPIDKDLSLLCFHGSPRSVHDVIVATTPDGQLDPFFGDKWAGVMAGGHTHLQMLRRYRDFRVVNPGSVGLPGVGAANQKNRHVRWAEYAVIDSRDEQVEIALRRVPLDVSRMLSAAQTSGMPALDWWQSLWSLA